MIRKMAFVLVMLTMAVNSWSQTINDTKCMTLMNVPLEGPDSMFIPALKSAGFEQVTSADDEPGIYYFSGDFYGIKSKLMVTVDEKTKLLTDATVVCGPYRTRELYERNQKYLLLKLQREWGDFQAKGDGSLHTMTDYGYIRQSTSFDDQGRHSIRYFYMNMAPYYKDAANMGMKGFVQEVITENPVMENDILHFNEAGKLTDEELVDREYNGYGYLVRAAMKEKNGGKSLLTYEYDDDNCLKRRTLVNPESGIRNVTDYRYNTDFEIIQQSYKAFNKNNECVISYTIKNDYSERDDTGNWTMNNAQLTYWEKGQRTQILSVKQTRVISYWDED